MTPAEREIERKAAVLSQDLDGTRAAVQRDISVCSLDRGQLVALLTTVESHVHRIRVAASLTGLEPTDDAVDIAYRLDDARFDVETALKRMGFTYQTRSLLLTSRVAI